MAHAAQATTQTKAPASPPMTPMGVVRAAMSPRVAAMLVPLAAVFFWLFYRWFSKQNQHSLRAMEDWGHAYAIPLISLYLVWRNREALSGCRVSVFWPGLAPVMLGIITYFAGEVTIQNHMVQGFSMVLTLFGVCLLLLGPAVIRWLVLPIGYLVFAVTISESIMLAITFKLQLIASQGAHIMLNIIGAPFEWFTVEIDGNTLHILHQGRDIPMNVAEACSGMRMVVAFLALSVAVAVLGCRQWWQRAALFMLATPVAVFMNVIRVTVLGLVSLQDPSLATGDAHTMIGTILLFPSLMLYLGIAWALRKASGELDGDKP